MQRVSQLMWAVSLASALMLAACGGGGGATPADIQAGNSIAVGEPNPSTAIDTGKFVALAQNDTCADIRNRLFVIDNRYVFAERAGSCADASYSYSLYGSSPEPVLCSQADSIAGPRVSCTDDKAKALFDVIVKHLDAADLGLGSAHKVEQVKFTVLNPSFVQIDRRNWSRIWTDRNVVVRDAASWAALWREHAGDDQPLPQIDFSTTMVLGVFMGSVESGCYATEITGLARKDGKLIVTRTDTGPRPAGGALEDTQACIAAITSPAHLVRTARSDEPVEFSTVVPKTQ